MLWTFKMKTYLTLSKLEKMELQKLMFNLNRNNYEIPQKLF